MAPPEGNEAPQRTRSSRPTADAWAAANDAELVELYRSTSADAAFAQLVTRYQARLYGLLLGMVGDAALAEELVQRALVKAATNIEKLRDGQAFYAWVIAIARTQALDELRAPRHSRREALESNFDERSSDSSPAEKQTVRDILGQMEAEERMALILSDLQGASTKELAIALGVRESAAKMRLKRAREHFRALYREQSQ